MDVTIVLKARRENSCAFRLNEAYAYLGGARSSAASSRTTALSLSPRLSNLSRASQGGESLVPALLSANLLCNWRITLCCLRIMDSRCARLASISFCFRQSLDSKSSSCEDNVRSCSAFSLVSRATRSSWNNYISRWATLANSCNVRASHRCAVSTPW